MTAQGPPLSDALPVLLLAGPSLTAGPAAEKEATSADLCLIYSGPLLRGVEVTKAV